MPSFRGRLDFMPSVFGRVSMPPSGFITMRVLKVTTKTSDQIAAGFTAVFNEMNPAEAVQRVTQEQRLKPYRTQVLKERRRGFTWKQIAAGMRDPRIGETVSAKVLKAMFGGEKTAPKPAVKRAPKAKEKPAPKAPKEHLILDPVTGERITPTPPSQPQPAPEPEAAEVQESGLPKEYQPPFNRAAPSIIRMGYVDDVAASVLGQEAVKEFGEGVDLMNDFIGAAMAEFDRLDYATAKARYRIKQDAWDDWRAHWCSARGLTD
jgi:hypothetical protein